MKTRHFHCPKCQEEFTIKGYWKWVITAVFHAFNFINWQDYRYTKCPHCQQRSLITWHTITKD